MEEKNILKKEEKVNREINIFKKKIKKNTK